MRRPRVVCIGGGTGQAQVLRGLAGFPVRLTSIVNVTDNGGHSGFLRKTLSIPPVGDVRNCLAALAHDGVATELMNTRFRQGALDGTSLGNLMLAALIPAHGSLSKAVAAMGRLLNVGHKVLPVADRPADICAELEGGRIVRGEWQIILRRPRLAIRRLFHEPPVPALTECLSAIRRADLIVICPGALLAAVVSCLVASGVREAVQSSRARIAQVCNIMTLPGQTDRFAVSDHFHTVARYLGRRPDALIVNTGLPDRRAMREYRRMGSELVRDDVVKLENVRVIRGDFLTRRPPPDDRGGRGLYLSLPHTIRHDVGKLSRILYRLAREAH
jgi:uncharacterized cofD-like protein